MSRFSRLGNDLYSGARSYNIVGRRLFWYLLSGILIAVSLVGLFGRGLNFGIEFSGGSELRVSQVSAQQMEDYEQRTDAIIEQVAPEGTTTITQIGDSTIRVQTGELESSDAEAARGDLAEEFGVDVADVTSSFVGPSWGETVTNRAIIALAVFLALVTVVLTFYFHTWKMAVAALVALIHDVFFTIGIYALIGIEVSPASVIGFLTILGYSIYDTIVVFDKVRENTEHAFDTKRQTFGEAANQAVNQTLVRSINTSVVALLPVAVILAVGVTLIGPGTLVDLAWALFIGIAVGTFSSIFIATPLLVHLREGELTIRRHDAQVLKRRARHEARAARGDDAEPEDGLEGGEDDLVGAGVGGQEPSGSRSSGTAATGGGSGGGQTSGRQLHPYAQRGPRNQPKRKRRNR
ncbi:Protein-export membrane protein SecF [Serinicoccus hydrothermalis]|uniref:Protein-export membrane protein SecF n=1 Tax=Serinicoccus hydrothermalis TaxID=1758689 RepID=A0A1B1N8U8_9MICO|nr:protein translocase subunit SecF [Serinicoccus hydrothermalis]ANS77838.1 Protein-export membrane protein SecF [Serinicoccus hydrothermalis]